MQEREAPCPTNKPHPTGMKLRTLRRGRRLRPLLHTARPAPEHQCLCHTARLPLNAGPTARPAPDCLRPRCAHGPLACCTRHAHGLNACAHSVFSARLPALARLALPSSFVLVSPASPRPWPLFHYATWPEVQRSRCYASPRKRFLYTRPPSRGAMSPRPAQHEHLLILGESTTSLVYVCTFMH